MQRLPKPRNPVVLESNNQAKVSWRHGDVYYVRLFFFQPSRKSKEDFGGTDVVLVDTEPAEGSFGVDVDHCDGWLGTEVDF